MIRQVANPAARPSPGVLAPTDHLLVKWEFPSIHHFPGSVENVHTACAPWDTLYLDIHSLIDVSAQ